MKNDNKDKLQAIKDELNKKVENIMGPAPENPNTASKQAPERYKPKEEKAKPKSAPAVSGAKSIQEPEAEAPKPKPEPVKASAEPDEPTDDMDKAVDDIAEKESDDILEAEDKEVEKAFKENEKKPGLLKRFWRNKLARNSVIFLLFAGILAAAAYPTSRYYLLNTFGVRSSASIRILDDSTQQPLKNVSVSIGNSKGETNEQGVASLGGVMLGEQNLKIERRAFATSEKTVTIGWGSNPLGDSSLSPTGLQFAFKVQDYLSGKPIVKAEAYSEDASAFSDKDGKVLLTLDTKGDEPVVIKVRADGYREETIKDDGTLSEKETAVSMVAAQKQLFITKRSGKYDVYKVDADGKNEELVLSGTGSEKSDIVLSTHPSGNVAALVSTRDNIRTSDGVLKSTLTLIETSTNKTQPIDSSERIQIIGWMGDQLVYVLVDEANKKDGVSTHKLISYDYTTDSKTEIVGSVFFNDVEIAKDRIYYAPAAEFVKGTEDDETPKVDESKLGLFSTDSAGGDKQKVIDKEIWSITRQDYNTLVFSSGQRWYSLDVNNRQTSRLSGEPASESGRIYVDNDSQSKSLWVDKRDGKGVLLAYLVDKGKDKTLASVSGLTNPVRWLNNTTAVFRVHTEQETADYAISTNGGKAKKITDVTDTKGAESWYYY